MLEDLDGHVPIEPRIISQEHLAEPAVPSRSRNWNRLKEPSVPRSQVVNQSIGSPGSVSWDSGGPGGSSVSDSLGPIRLVRLSTR